MNETKDQITTYDAANQMTHVMLSAAIFRFGNVNCMHSTYRALMLREQDDENKKETNQRKKDDLRVIVNISKPSNQIAHVVDSPRH